jgi:uncharacterized protein
MLKRLVIAFLVPFLFVATTASASSTVDDDKAKAIKHLIQITKAAEIGIQFATAISQQLTKTIKKIKSDVPSVAFEIINIAVLEEMNASKNEMINMMVLLYDKYFTKEEILDITAFYETETGKKAVSTLPTLMKEAMAAGEIWGQALARRAMPKIQQRFKAEGIDL